MTEPIDQATKDLIKKEAQTAADFEYDLDYPDEIHYVKGYIRAATVWAEKLKRERNKAIEYRSLLESILRLKTILTYEENIPPEHEGEAIAINNLFYKIERTLKDKSHE